MKQVLWLKESSLPASRVASHSNYSGLLVPKIAKERRALRLFEQAILFELILGCFCFGPTLSTCSFTATSDFADRELVSPRLLPFPSWPSSLVSPLLLPPSSPWPPAFPLLPLSSISDSTKIVSRNGNAQKKTRTDSFLRQCRSALATVQIHSFRRDYFMNTFRKTSERSLVTSDPGATGKSVKSHWKFSEIPLEIQWISSGNQWIFTGNQLNFTEWPVLRHWNSQ